MQNLDLEHACAGMVLGQDILGGQGQMLLRAGVVLSDRHLQVLYANQVREIAIIPPPAPLQDAVLSGAEIALVVEERFRNCDAGQPLIQELRRLCHTRLTQR